MGWLRHKNDDDDDDDDDDEFWNMGNTWLDMIRLKIVVDQLNLGYQLTKTGDQGAKSITFTHNITGELIQTHGWLNASPKNGLARMVFHKPEKRLDPAWGLPNLLVQVSLNLLREAPDNPGFHPGLTL